MASAVRSRGRGDTGDTRAMGQSAPGATSVSPEAQRGRASPGSRRLPACHAWPSAESESRARMADRPAACSRQAYIVPGSVNEASSLPPLGRPRCKHREGRVAPHPRCPGQARPGGPFADARGGSAPTVGMPDGHGGAVQCGRWRLRSSGWPSRALERAPRDIWRLPRAVGQASGRISQPDGPGRASLAGRASGRAGQPLERRASVGVQPRERRAR
jgi:hypothetical protein